MFVDKILLLDFGGTQAQSVARKLRGERIYCEVLPHDAPLEAIQAAAPRGIILAGAGTDGQTGDCDARIFALGLPVLAMGHCSALLAEALGELLRLPVIPTLRKRRHTKRQSGIEDPGKRAENVRGVYTVREEGAGRHVLLTDDVITTGATLREAAAVLEAAGWHCTALCFACTPEKV